MHTTRQMETRTSHYLQALEKPIIQLAKIHLLILYNQFLRCNITTNKSESCYAQQDIYRNNKTHIQKKKYILMS